MNAVLLKTDETLTDEDNETRTGHPPLEEQMATPELADDELLSEGTNRRIYRRSVAYFVFGFGCNRHSIVTDEPSS